MKILSSTKFCLFLTSPDKAFVGATGLELETEDRKVSALGQKKKTRNNGSAGCPGL
jgi:hypothetical protein